MYACFRRIRSDISCLYLEIFSYKLRAARSDHLQKYILSCTEIINLNCMIFCCISTQLFHIPSEFTKMIASACGFVGIAFFIHHFEHSRCVLAEPYHVVSCFRFDQVMCDWLNHTMWFHLNSALPRRMEFESILLHFLTQQTPICNVGCLIIANTWIYISLYIRNTAILENKKSVSIFLHQLVNTCDLHLFRLLKCTICRTIPVKMLPIGQLLTILKVY